MKKSYFKKVTIFLLTLGIIALTTENVSASPAISDIYENAEIEILSESYETTAINEAVSYLVMSEKYTDINNLYVSNGYNVYGSEDSTLKVFFVFDNNKCIGELCLFDSCGEIMSSYIQLESNELSLLYEDGISFCLLSTGEILYAYSSGDELLAVVVGGINEYENIDNLLTLYSDTFLKEEKIELTPLKLTTAKFEESSTNSATYYTLSVPIISNSTVSGEGICWCASIASIGAYRTNTTALTAKSLYNILKSKYDDTPTGNVTWEMRAFDYYDISYDYVASGLEYSSVVKVLKWNRPIMASITTTSGNIAHAIVICGYTPTTTDGYYYYQIMDPNVSGSYVNVKINTSASTFNYTYGSIVYTNWRRSFY